MAPKGQSSKSGKGIEIPATNFIMYTGMVDKPFVPFCNFLQNCALSFALTEAPTMPKDIIVEMWTSADIAADRSKLVVKIRGKNYSVSSKTLNKALNFPINDLSEPASDHEIYA